MLYKKFLNDYSNDQFFEYVSALIFNVFYVLSG